ncbi:WAT1-related protein At4g30420-like isoform X1 [Humulus lupulus]|uniref:WAT1-related protein At4g30420-like isoform X1 n=1 Tax=Humulus lupulus TaxID=3486 RepID=UPI002B415DF5|nr:WAT1-related protein At4g30420-like isoform X1 [Humulus lupulus]
MCLLTTIQSAIYTFVTEPDLQVWNLHSYLELGSCLYAGIGTAVSFFVQAWCIQLRGPVFVAMFSPLCTVITAIIASLFLHEKLYAGRFRMKLFGGFDVFQLFGLVYFEIWVSLAWWLCDLGIKFLLVYLKIFL